MLKINWVCKTFDELSSAALYAALKLRSEVFVVEQNCVYLDADDKDSKSHHLLGYLGQQLVTYSRLLPANVSYPDFISIGRVVSAPPVRKLGVGKALMNKSIAECFRLFGPQAIKIGAQFYLKNFYESFGFIQTSDIYDEDGIPHIEMVRSI